MSDLSNHKFAEPFFRCQQQAFGFLRGHLIQHGGNWQIFCLSDCRTFPIQLNRGVSQKIRKADNHKKVWDFRVYFRTTPYFPGLVFRAINLAPVGEYPDELIDRFIVRGNLYSWDRPDRKTTIAIQPRHEKKKQAKSKIPIKKSDKPQGFRIVLEGIPTGTQLLPSQFWQLECDRENGGLKITRSQWQSNPLWASPKGTKSEEEQQQNRWDKFFQDSAFQRRLVAAQA